MRHCLYNGSSVILTVGFVELGCPLLMKVQVALLFRMLADCTEYILRINLLPDE